MFLHFFKEKIKRFYKYSLYKKTIYNYTTSTLASPTNLMNNKLLTCFNFIFSIIYIESTMTQKLQDFLINHIIIIINKSVF